MMAQPRSGRDSRTEREPWSSAGDVSRLPSRCHGDTQWKLGGVLMLSMLFPFLGHNFQIGLRNNSILMMYGFLFREAPSASPLAFHVASQRQTH